MDVLIAYATKHGSTGEVAETVRNHGARAVLYQARAVRGPVAGHDLVVLGAPLYSGRWHRDAHRFMRKHRQELAAVAVCPAPIASAHAASTVDLGMATSRRPRSP